VTISSKRTKTKARKGGHRLTNLPEKNRTHDLVYRRGSFSVGILPTESLKGNHITEKDKRKNYYTSGRGGGLSTKGRPEERVFLAKKLPFHQRTGIISPEADRGALGKREKVPFERRAV